MLKRAALTLAKVAAGAYIATLVALFLAQNWILFAGRAKYYRTPAADHVPFDDVWLKTADGTRVHSWFIPAAGEARATILYFHGNGGNISSTLYEQERFRMAGFDSLAVDYNGYGESEGAPSESALYGDAEAAWNWVEARKKPIVIWGYSLGGGVASFLAQRHSPSALVLQSTFTSLADDAAAIYPIFPVRLLLRSSIPTKDRLTRNHAPLVVIHGDRDRKIEEWQARENFEASLGKKAFVEFHGGHESEFFHTPGTWETVDAFLVSTAGLPARQ